MSTPKATHGCLQLVGKFLTICSFQNVLCCINRWYTMVNRTLHNTNKEMNDQDMVEHGGNLMHIVKSSQSEGNALYNSWKGEMMETVKF